MAEELTLRRAALTPTGLVAQFIDLFRGLRFR
jgi:hypothetical protein